jgi:hypothetical protein
MDVDMDLEHDARLGISACAGGKPFRSRPPRCSAFESAQLGSATEIVRWMVWGSIARSAAVLWMSHKAGDEQEKKYFVLVLEADGNVIQLTIQGSACLSGPAFCEL